MGVAPGVVALRSLQDRADHTMSDTAATELADDELCDCGEPECDRFNDLLRQVEEASRERWPHLWLEETREAHEAEVQA